jgi:hypothetical protein
MKRTKKNIPWLTLLTYKENKNKTKQKNKSELRRNPTDPKNASKKRSTKGNANTFVVYVKSFLNCYEGVG